MPRFAEIEGSRVRYVLPPELADDYPVLVQNQVEIALDADVVQGDIYEDGEFRRITAEELQAAARPRFDAERQARFDQTKWVRERFGDYAKMYELGQITEAVFIVVKNKYEEWLVYWQALRDMPDAPEFDTANPTWPESPE